MRRDVPRHHRRADLARPEGAFALVDRAHHRALRIRQRRQADGAGQVVLCEFGRRAHVDHGVEAMVGDVGERLDPVGHALRLPRPARPRKRLLSVETLYSISSARRRSA
jgi:hypothetical protein